MIPLMMIIKSSLVAIVILIIVVISLIYYIVTLMFFTKSKINLLDVRISGKSPDIICLMAVLPKYCYILPKAESYQIKDYNRLYYDCS